MSSAMVSPVSPTPIPLSPPSPLLQQGRQQSLSVPAKPAPRKTITAASLDGGGVASSSRKTPPVSVPLCRDGPPRDGSDELLKSLEAAAAAMGGEDGAGMAGSAGGAAGFAARRRSEHARRRSVHRVHHLAAIKTRTGYGGGGGGEVASPSPLSQQFPPFPPLLHPPAPPLNTPATATLLPEPSPLLLVHTSVTPPPPTPLLATHLASSSSSSAATGAQPLSSSSVFRIRGTGRGRSDGLLGRDEAVSTGGGGGGGDDDDDDDFDLDNLGNDAGANLLPLLSPVAASAQRSPTRQFFPGQPRSLEGIAVRAFCLGAALALSTVATLALLVLPQSGSAGGSSRGQGSVRGPYAGVPITGPDTATPNDWAPPSSNGSWHDTLAHLWRLPFFVGCLSLFHFLEFWSTAAHNPAAATVASFLLTANWPAYALAHAFALAECLAVALLWPNRALAPLAPWGGRVLLGLGLALVAAGQMVRTAAMAQCGPSFNHTIQQRRRDTHALVTTGIYASLRHPSYFGFFWWAVGTQLVLGNVLALLLYVAVLWKFFSSRIEVEEELLVRFFGDEYEDYRKKVRTMIPFIR